jgi:serine/threonine protein kinase
MAPEQITDGHVDARTDLFALGAIGDRLLTGEHHVPLDRSARAIETQIVEDGPPSYEPWNASPIPRTATWRN